MSRLKILATFDSIVDVNYGIIQIVKENYANARYINKEMLDSIDDNVIFDVLTTHEDKSIFSLLLNQKYKNSAEKLQKEIIDTEYNAVISKSCVTNILSLLKVYIQSGDVEVFVLCKNKIEEQFIKKYIKGSTILVSNDIKMIDTSPYDVFFIKDADTMSNLGDISGKKIYISNYKFNLETNKNHTVNIKTSAFVGVPYQFEINIVDSFIIPDKYKIKG